MPGQAEPPLAVPHNQRMTEPNALHPYAELTPDRVMDALTDLGLWPDGRLLALSSYENRVYRAHLDEPVQGSAAVVLKFYRPGRWSREQIQEEHDFAAELLAAEVPVVPPMVLLSPKNSWMVAPASGAEVVASVTRPLKVEVVCARTTRGTPMEVHSTINRVRTIDAMMRTYR